MNDILTFMQQDSPIWLTLLAASASIISGFALISLWCWNKYDCDILTVGLVVVAVVQLVCGIFMTKPPLESKIFADTILLVIIVGGLDFCFIYTFCKLKAEEKAKPELQK
jgi:uncharacterized membrane-anchored protein